MQAMVRPLSTTTMASPSLDMLETAAAVATFGAARATGLLQALGDSASHDVATLAARCHLDPRAVELTMHALTVIGVVDRVNDTYGLAGDLGPWIGLDLLRETVIAVLEGRPSAELAELHDWLQVEAGRAGERTRCHPILALLLEEPPTDGATNAAPTIRPTPPNATR